MTILFEIHLYNQDWNIILYDKIRSQLMPQIYKNRGRLLVDNLFRSTSKLLGCHSIKKLTTDIQSLWPHELLVNVIGFNLIVYGWVSHTNSWTTKKFLYIICMIHSLVLYSGMLCLLSTILNQQCMLVSVSFKCSLRLDTNSIQDILKQKEL